MIPWLGTAGGNDDRTELEELKKRVAQLEADNPQPLKPSTQPKYDPTAFMTMPQSALDALTAVGTDLVRSIVADNRHSVALPTAKAGPSVRGTGWADQKRLAPPPGIAIMDQMMDAEDALDRVDRIKRRGGV